MTHQSPFDALREMVAPMPATQRVQCATAPKVRATRCGKCPFGGADLAPFEEKSAELLRARLAGRMAGGENVAWGCHETVGGAKPQLCAGFIDWTSARPELE